MHYRITNKSKFCADLLTAPEEFRSMLGASDSLFRFPALSRFSLDSVIELLPDELYHERDEDDLLIFQQIAVLQSDEHFLHCSGDDINVIPRKDVERGHFSYLDVDLDLHIVEIKELPFLRHDFLARLSSVTCG